MFWGLSASLAYKRHFPAIDWLISYSLYADKMKEWYDTAVGKDFFRYRTEVMKILQEEAALDEIVRLVGMDALSAKDRLTMETAKMIREDFLHQNAFHEVDTYTSLKKQLAMLKLICGFREKAGEAVAQYVELNDILNSPFKEKIGRAKYVPEENAEQLEKIYTEMLGEIKALCEGEREDV